MKHFHNITTNLGTPEPVAVRLEELEAESMDLRARLAAVEKEQQRLLSERTITCPECSGVFPLRDLVFRHVRYYVPPRGCTDGDYWTSAGVHEVDCCGCNMRLRLLEGTGAKINPFSAHKYFRAVKEVYND